jgi:hypothetical protein
MEAIQSKLLDSNSSGSWWSRENHASEFLYSCINEFVSKEKATKGDYQRIKLCKVHILNTERWRLEKLKITGKSLQTTDDERTTRSSIIEEKS